jgi:hypothetical protein
VNPEAGDVDGVISLMANSEQAAALGSQAVAAHMRREMPAIEIIVTDVVAGPDYVTAYSQLHPGGTTWQPAAPEITVALPCAYCGHDPATRTRDLSPDRREQPVCADCDGRLARAGFSSTSTGHLLPRDQARVLEWLGHGSGLPDGFPSDFGALTALDGHATHVATIFCDGNRVGALFEALASSNLLSKRDLAVGIDGATTTSLAAAIRAVWRAEDRYLPISVHLVGGDDLLVSVPAKRGWEFTQSYLRGFGEALAQWRRSAGVESRTVSPTASAGVVFHHHSYPFSLVVVTAERALKAAKKSFRGCEAAIAWADITTDDTTVHGPRSVAWFDAQEASLADLARTAASQRALLGRLSVAEIPDQLRRQGLVGASRLFEQDPSALSDALSIVKWRQSVE